jgi:hypothetical protein
LEAAQSTTCPPEEEPTLYIPVRSDDTSEDLTDAISNWMLNQQLNNADIQAAFGLNDGNTMGVIVNEYVVVDANGRVYPTCVQHGGSGDACVDELVCWNGVTAGAASEQRSALLAAAKRNNYKNANCPGIQTMCAPLSTFWTDMMVDRSFDQSVIDNTCVSDGGDVMYVTMDAYKKVCVGLTTMAQPQNVECPMSNDDVYFCSAVTNGLATFGFPAQTMNALEQAYETATAGGMFMEDSFTHPQCRGFMGM